MEWDFPQGADQYFETIQPEWKKLGFTTEVVRLFWEYPEANDITAVDPVVEANVEERVSRQLRFLRALDLIDESDKLTPNGIWLATVYQPPAQQPVTSADVSIERKDTLGATEQEAFRGLLLGHHWLPMLATAHQLSGERVPAKQSEGRHVTSFSERLDSIEEYSDLSSGAWQTRAEVHYNWFCAIGFARRREGELALTEDGHAFHDRVEQYYPPEWDDFVA